MPTTPYMSLLLPTPTVTLGPLYANQNNTAFTTVDQHDHSPGKGVPVNTQGISINADFPINGFNLLSVNSTRYNDLSTPLAGIADITSMYVSGGNLYYNNATGQQVQITSGAGLNAGSIGGIGGDYATSGASVYYTNLTVGYSFTSSGNVYSNMFQGATTIYPTGTNTVGVTLQAPALLPASYNLTFANSLPLSTSFLTVDASGNLDSSISTSGGITGSNIAAGTITGSNIADGSVTNAKLSALNIQTSASCAGTGFSFSPSYQPITNLSVSITTTGRPVMMILQPDGISDAFGQLNGSPQNFLIALFRDSTNVREFGYNFFPASGSYADFIKLDCTGIDTPSAGSHTYSVQIKVANNNGVIAFVNNYVLTVYEL